MCDAEDFVSILCRGGDVVSLYRNLHSIWIPGAPNVVYTDTIFINFWYLNCFSCTWAVSITVNRATRHTSNAMSSSSTQIAMRPKMPISLDPSFQVYFNFIYQNNTSISKRLPMPKSQSPTTNKKKFKIMKAPSPKAISQLKLPSCYLQRDHGVPSTENGLGTRARRPLVVGSYLSNKIPVLKRPVPRRTCVLGVLAEDSKGYNP